MKTIKIDWSKLPGWAKYAAVDGDGSLYCFEKKPVFCHATGGWENELLTGSRRWKRLSEAGVYKIDGQYYDTLVKRPVKSEVPNWDNAPEWANWTAQNKDGNWNWFEAEPELYDYRFFPVDFTKHQFALRSENTDGWESSLEKKPNEVVVEFFDEPCDDTIDWNEAPEWANYAVQKHNREWHFLEFEPCLNDDKKNWRFSGLSSYYKKTCGTKDWRHTLQKRPKDVVNERPRFESARVGDKVYSLSYGSGVVSDLGFDDDDYPIRVIFDDDKTYADFTIDGKSCLDNANPTLYWSKPTITGGDIPPERMVSIGGYEYPEPERFAPEKETVFYVPVNNGSFSVTAHHKWTGGENQQFLLESGGVHLKRENALQHSEARGLALKDLQGGDSFLINSKVLDALC